VQLSAITSLAKSISRGLGDTFSLYLNNDGTVWATGQNNLGQLGTGTFDTGRAVFGQVEGFSGVVDIATGVAHSLALKSDSSVWSWGNNNVGQIGNGTTFPNNVSVPTLVIFPQRQFSANLRVSVEQVVAGSRQTDSPLEVKVFDVRNGVIDGNLPPGISITPQNYAMIYANAIAENTATETNSPIVGKSPRNLITDLVSIGAKTGNKLILVRSQQNADGSYGYMGFDVPNLLDGQTRDLGFNVNPKNTTTFVQTSYFTQNSNGVWQSARRSEVIKGSELSIFQADEVQWTNGTQIYPFLFISDSDWSVDICLEVPAGYQVVAPGACGQVLVANEVKIVEFQISDIGSPKEFDVKTKITTTHKGKKTKVEGKIHSFNKNAKN
jgi:hypothetical protein